MKKFLGIYYGSITDPLGRLNRMNSYRRNIIAAALSLSTLICGVARAEDEAAKPAAPAGPSFGDILTNSGITATGFVAASYYHSNGYNTYHQFDTSHDTFQLDEAGLTVAYQPKDGFGALVDVRAGEDMKILNGAEGSNPNTFDIVQGFVQYAHGPITVMGGKFVTLVGAEVIAPTGNTQFSRSFLFYAEPLTHTGVRAAFAVNDTITLTLGVNNGWNSTSLPTSGSKTGEFGASWIPNKMFSLFLGGYVGAQTAPDDPSSNAQRTIIDGVATFNATANLTFILSYDWGQQDQHLPGDSSLAWNGVALYTNYAITDQWRASLRLEYFDDKDGFVMFNPYLGTQPSSQILKEGTLTIGYDPVKSFELRLEARYDMSTEKTFTRTIPSEGLNADPFANSQSEFAIQGIYKF
jgi:Putative beta-barrel porin-2, OmpL-like. bbp2